MNNIDNYINKKIKMLRKYFFLINKRKYNYLFINNKSIGLNKKYSFKKITV